MWYSEGRLKVCNYRKEGAIPSFFEVWNES